MNISARFGITVIVGAVATATMYCVKAKRSYDSYNTFFTANNRHLKQCKKTLVLSNTLS